ncbi:MAG: hypothetical protein V3T96_06080 [Thermodesulfobacteriota bacterium]
MKRCVSIILALTLLSGCSSAYSVKIGFKNYPPKPDTYNVPILSPDDVHNTHITVIGKIYASKELLILFEETVVSMVVKMMEEQARKLGADAMVNLTITKQFDRLLDNYIISGKADAVVFETSRGKAGEGTPKIIKPKEYDI